MAMRKSVSKSKSTFTGSWHIVSMSGWDEDYVNEEVQAYIEFKRTGGGDFHFGFVQGDIDYRTTIRDGNPSVEFSWDGVDDADFTPFSGRGWAILERDKLYGMFFIHQGDESEFVGTRARAGKGKRKK
jgi:hypothetical protein